MEPMTTVLSKLAGRSLLTLDDITDTEMQAILNLARDLKKARREGRRARHLEGKHVAMVFEKSSTRTRCATAVAVADEGGATEYLSSHDIHLGKKESVADTARVLGRMFHGIMYRGFAQRTVELLAEHSGVPVWNALTDDCHPTQALADLMTIEEHFGRLRGLRMVYIGDGRNNVANSLMLGCAKAGMDFVNCTPPELMPDHALVAASEAVARRNGSSVRIVNNPRDAMTDANVVYTDVWVSMGEESKKEERLRLLRPYQVNMDLMRLTGNVERGRVIFLHCLPAFHDSNTEVTAHCGPLEVTDEVFAAPFSCVFDEAENRMHTIKALLVATLAERDTRAQA